MDDRDRGADEGRAVRLHFEIAGLSPRTVPVGRLARYLSLLSTALGDPKGMSLVAIGEGSLRAAFEAPEDVVTGIRARVAALDHGTAPAKSAKALRNLRRELSDSGAGQAALRADGASMLRVAPLTDGEREIGPIRQSGSLQGIPIRVGGRNNPVPVHLQSSGRVYYCHADRELARQIGAHLFRKPVRVFGEGDWLRKRSGTWVIKSFRVDRFKEIDDAPLSVVMKRLQAIDAEWKKRPDPLGDLMRLRKGDDWVE